MERNVFVILDSMELEIDALNVMKLVENAQDQAQINA